MDTAIYTRDNIPINDFSEFTTKGTTRMVRISGPFVVETKEGTISCQDGWLAVDSEGDPYPIADNVQREVYEQA